MHCDLLNCLKYDVCHPARQSAIVAHHFLENILRYRCQQENLDKYLNIIIFMSSAVSHNNFLSIPTVV